MFATSLRNSDVDVYVIYALLIAHCMNITRAECM